jgi:hypothetical protein
MCYDYGFGVAFILWLCCYGLVAGLGLFWAGWFGLVFLGVVWVGVCGVRFLLFGGFFVCFYFILLSFYCQ